MISYVHSPEDMEHYTRLGIQTMAKNRVCRVDPTLLETIWQTLHALHRGYNPFTACQFGREAIPLGKRPSFEKLEEILQEHRRNREEKEMADWDMDAAVDAFMASMERGKCSLN